MSKALNEKNFTNLKFESFIDIQESKDTLDKAAKFDDIPKTGVKT